MYACMQECVYTLMNGGPMECMYVCAYVCIMYVCIMYVCMYVCMPVRWWRRRAGSGGGWRCQRAASRAPSERTRCGRCPCGSTYIHHGMVATYTCMHVCMYQSRFKKMSFSAYIHTVHTEIHTYIHTYILSVRI